ncbi:MAG: cytochrome c [Ignavibacteriaceae bacterium]|jgi:mono/diheme cytochrome c family protein
MTKPQIWISAFLFLFILLFILGRVTKEDETEHNFPVNNSPGTEETNTEITGAQLFVNFGCIKCHGENLTGTADGPQLANLTEYWNRQALIAYLRNPSSFMEEERFKEYRQMYPKQIMPDFGNKNIKDLGKLADFLLNH